MSDPVVIEVEPLSGFGVVFYTLIVIAGCVAYAVLLHNWLRSNAYQGQRKGLHDAVSILLALGLFVAFAVVAHPV